MVQEAVTMVYLENDQELNPDNTAVLFINAINNIVNSKSLRMLTFMI